MVDYTYYQNTFLGNQIKELDFPRLSARASEYISHLTLGKSEQEPIVEDVKKAICAVAEVIQQGERSSSLHHTEEQGQPIVRSQSIDGVSLSYATNDTSTADGQQALQQLMQSTAYQYLLKTGLLYRGVGLC